MEISKTRIAIVGGGPSGLFMYKRLVESGHTDLDIDIFEQKHQLGAGMPYSHDGANVEHITNVSDNEIPHIVTSVEEWLPTLSKQVLDKFCIDLETFHEYRVFPRLLFGMYLSAQFDLLLDIAKKTGITTNVHLNSNVTDIIDDPEGEEVGIETEGNDVLRFDLVIICTGHKWPVKYEGVIPGYFDSPYPPAKLKLKINHPIAIKGAALTAIDAIRTLARHNGTFQREKNGKVSYHPAEECPEFKMVMHSRNGLLPAVRFHLEDPHLSKKSLLSKKELMENKDQNEGFLSLDFLFEKDFKEMFRSKDVEFYEKIKDLSLEDFVGSMMDLRERIEPFQLFKAEYVEAEKSIERKQSVYWKELLAVLSFAMNYPAKYFSAEDMLRLQKVLMPLISLVIAFVPQSSCEELLALHDAGKLDIVPVGYDSEVEPQSEGGVVYHYEDEEGLPQSEYYETFVDCVGQPHLSYEAFPFKTLVNNKTVSPAHLKFRSEEEGKIALAEGDKKVEKTANGDYYLKVPGITINDNFQVVDGYGAYNSRVYMMAVPYIGGYNPDYSGLDFCEEASASIVKSILKSYPIG